MAEAWKISLPGLKPLSIDRKLVFESTPSCLMPVQKASRLAAFCATCSRVGGGRVGWACSSLALVSSSQVAAIDRVLVSSTRGM